MISHNCKEKKLVRLMFFLLALMMLGSGLNVFAEEPKPIVISKIDESIYERMERAITLDVRDMNIVDVVKFLALKGEFNVVISPTVEGRSTVLLNSVSIKDALDIIIISNHLAYKIQSNIVQIMSSAE